MILFVFIILISPKLPVYQPKSPTMHIIKQIRIIRLSTVKIIVRIEFEGEEYRIVSHGTYTESGIVTHNHYEIPFGSENVSGNVLLFDIDDNWLKTIPFENVALVEQYHQTVIIDVGLLSLEPAAISNHLQSNTVLYIDWINHETVIRQAAIRTNHKDYVEYYANIEHGSSGGGVFSNGYLIANNWMVNEIFSTGAKLMLDK